VSAARFHESWRDLAHAVNREPEENWRAQSAHHGVRAAVVVVLALGLPLLFPGQEAPEQSRLEPGMVAPADQIASFEMPVPKPPEQLERERAIAERAVPPIFQFDPAAADSSEARVAAFLEELGRALATSEDPQNPAVEQVLASYDVSLGPAQLAYLDQPQNRREVRESLSRAFRELLPAGVASPQAISSFDQERVVLRDGEDRTARRDSLTTVGDYAEAAFAYAPSSVQGFRAFQSLLLAFTVPSLRPDETAWMAERQLARAQVDSTVGVILEGERIVTAHERVTQSQYDRLQAYNAELSRRRGSLINRGGALAGRVMFTALLLALVGATLFLFRPYAYRELRHFLIVIGLVAMSVAGAALVEGFSLPAQLVPIVVVALAIGAVYDGMLALVAVLASTLLLMGLATLAPLYDPVTLALGGAVAALGVRGVRRRRQSWVLIAGITAAYLAGGLALTLLGGFSFGSFLGTIAWGFVGATLYTVLTLGGLVPLLEKVTGISTAQTLLELSDLNAPLLRELSLKAPGTYAHSINIANLAEAACEAIGADSLLVRAGSYYHDIGKMVNPQYFVENQPKGRNPHDRLPPLRSAAIIRDHVRDGVRLAVEHRLPPMIHDFIREHHGTGLIRFFYDKAVEEAGEEAAGDINPGDFAYLGPKPQSRETAILMLADGIESATRVLGDPTPERIRTTIDAIVDARFSEGQLDQCPLTLREIDRSKAAFARVLIGMYHRRIDYPSGVRSREDGDDDVARAEPPSTSTPSPRLRRRSERQGSEDQLEAALEAVDAADPEASVRAADE
jgi:hypothetical protein